jgi:hypothetical protein
MLRNHSWVGCCLYLQSIEIGQQRTGEVMIKCDCWALIAVAFVVVIDAISLTKTDESRTHKISMIASEGFQGLLLEIQILGSCNTAKLLFL